MNNIKLFKFSSHTNTMVKDYSWCRFCNVDTFKTRTVKRYKHVIVVLSNPRLMKGHLLVIPKRHVEKLSELRPVERKELFDVVARYSEKVLRLSEGYNIHQNYMSMLEETRIKVDHMHIHIRPSESKDELILKMFRHQEGIFKDISEKECKEMLKKLK